MNNITLNPEPTLTTLAQGLIPTGFIADKVFPRVVSETLTGYLGRVNGNYMRIVNTATKGLGSNVVSYKWDRNQQFEVVEHELENVISAGDAERAGGWDAAKKKFMLQLDLQLKLAREYAIASTLGSSSVITNYTTLTGGDQWSTSTSDVLGVIATAKASVTSATGQPANTVIMSYPVFMQLQKHPSLQSFAMYKDGQPLGVLSAEMMAMIFGVERVLVGYPVYNSAKEGATASYTHVWGKNCIVAYIAPSDMIEIDAGLGAQIVAPAKMPEFDVSSYTPINKNPNQVQVIRELISYDDLLANSDAAYLIAAAVA